MGPLDAYFCRFLSKPNRRLAKKSWLKVLFADLLRETNTAECGSSGRGVRKKLADESS
jgi:hypothetical protein